MKGGKVMTRNQIEYQKYLEDKRHNQTVETETNRNNVAGLGETTRYNTLVTSENQKHNRVVEGETGRHNVVTEQQLTKQTSINWVAQQETGRHNEAQEALTNYANISDRRYKQSMAQSTRDMTDSNIIKNKIGNLNDISETTAKVKDYNSAADLKKQQSATARSQEIKNYVNIGTDGINAATKIFDSLANFVPAVGATNGLKRSISGAVAPRSVK